MKEIGLEFKEKREEGGLSALEVADDLKVKVEDITKLENGEKQYFSDIYFLKDLISNYAKYLGLDGSKLLDEFNEYMFSETSRISLDDIEKAKEKIIEQEKEKINSPYTKINKNKKKLVLCFLGVFLFLMIVFFVSFFVFKDYTTTKNISGDVSYVIGGE